jgi:serine protease Do
MNQVSAGSRGFSSLANLEKSAYGECTLLTFNLIMKNSAFLALPLLLLATFTPSFSEIGHPPGMLGVAVDEVVKSHVTDLSLPGEYGARVTNVGPGSPAEKAGLESGDVIVSYNGVRVESARAFQRMVLETPAGRQVELRVIRSGAAVLVQPVLGEGRLPTAANAPVQAPKSLGVWIESIAPAVGQYLGLDEGVGVIVREVQADSVAETAGIQAKDVLTHIGETPINGPETVADAVGTLGVPVATFTLIRGTETIDVTVRF